MKKDDKDDVELEIDELRSEYDLSTLKIRKVGPERKHFGGPTVRLEADVAELFPDSESVNEALRFLIRVTKRKEGDLKIQENRLD